VNIAMDEMYKAMSVENDRYGDRVGIELPPDDAENTPISTQPDESAPRPRGKVDVLLGLIPDDALFAGTDEHAYVALEVAGHRETWPVNSSGFRRWLRQRFFDETGGAPNSEAMTVAIATFEARAFSAARDLGRREIYLRVARIGDEIWIDLCNDSWSAINVTSRGWEIVEVPPVHFRRTKGMRALPNPTKPQPNPKYDQHCSPAEAHRRARMRVVRRLRRLLNLRKGREGKRTFVLVVAWLLAALSGRKPYPVLVLAGEHGTAKTSFLRFMRALIDPHAADIRSAPRDEDALQIAAGNSFVQAYDNLSSMPPWMSDALCRLSTGAAYSKRTLYTDREEELIVAARPVALNGIEDVVSRPDLADRTVFVSLEPIRAEKRLTEAAFNKAVADVAAAALGMLLDLLSEGLRNESTVQLAELPRMADFALWSTACETAVWAPGTFMASYTANREGATETIIEQQPVAFAVTRLMAKRKKWTGTMTELLAALGNVMQDRVVRSKSWPSVAHHLSGRLRRAQPSLRAVGIDIEIQRADHAAPRTVTIRNSNVCAPARASAGTGSCSLGEPPLLEADDPGPTSDDIRWEH
jgi:hypothetical protein